MDSDSDWDMIPPKTQNLDQSEISLENISESKKDDENQLYKKEKTKDKEIDLDINPSKTQKLDQSDISLESITETETDNENHLNAEGNLVSEIDWDDFPPKNQILQENSEETSDTLTNLNIHWDSDSNSEDDQLNLEMFVKYHR